MNKYLLKEIFLALWDGVTDEQIKLILKFSDYRISYGFILRLPSL